MTACRPEVRHGPCVMGPSSRVHRRGPAVARPSSRACRRDRGALSARLYGVSRTPTAPRSPRGTAAA